MNILLDTDVIIDALKGKTTFNPTDNYSISIISYGEILFGFGKNSQLSKQLTVFQKLIDHNIIKIIDITPEIIKTFTQIKFELEFSDSKLEDFDLFIAATAIHLNYPLQTCNTKQFNQISELNIM